MLVLEHTNHSQKEVRMRIKRSAPFMTKQTKAIPTFANEAEERAYWDEKAAQDKVRYQRDMEVYNS